MKFKFLNSCKIVILILIFSNIACLDVMAHKVKLKGEYKNNIPGNNFGQFNSTILSQPIVEEDLKDLSALNLDQLIKVNLTPIATKLKKYKCYKLTIANNTDRPIIFLADDAYLTYNDKKLDTFEIAKLFKVFTTTGYEFKSAAKAAIPAALTVGAYPTVKDILDTKKPFLDQFGLDELRRKEQFSSFLERVIYSNESSDGRIYFVNNFNFKGSTLHLPIRSLYNQKDGSTILVKVTD